MVELRSLGNACKHLLGRKQTLKLDEAVAIYNPKTTVERSVTKFPKSNLFGGQA